MATGWTWEYVWETMTLERLDAMQRVWLKCPPSNVSLLKLSKMLGAFLGIQETAPSAQPAPAFENPPEFEE